MQLLSAKVLTLSYELFDNTDKMCMHGASGQSCIIGNISVMEVLMTCPKVTANFLENGVIMGRLSLGLLK